MPDSDDVPAEPTDPGLAPILARIPERWGKRVDTGPGWFPIVVELDRQLAAIDPAYVVHQVKEKFGGLRVYIHTDRDAVTEQVDALVRTAEAKAAVTCEECGGAGTVHQNRNGGIATLCPACAVAGGFEALR